MTVKAHGERGLELLGAFPWTKGPIQLVVACHHERFDGSGYPRGLRKGQISEESLIVGLADSYDAMISDLPHRKRMDPAIAFRLLQSQSGKDWDPDIVWAFQRYVAPYPVNSLVKLNTDEQARVIAVRPTQLYKPLVVVNNEEYDLATDRERRIVASLLPRRLYREKMSLPVEVRVAGRSVIPGTLVDLSLNGLSIIGLQTSIHPGVDVDITIPVPVRRATIDIQGTVVWCRPVRGGYQFGVSFKSISATNKEKLLEAIWGTSVGESTPS